VKFQKKVCDFGDFTKMMLESFKNDWSWNKIYKFYTTYCTLILQEKINFYFATKHV
jgi:hypothetical protein